MEFFNRIDFNIFLTASSVTTAVLLLSFNLYTLLKPPHLRKKLYSTIAKTDKGFHLIHKSGVLFGNLVIVFSASLLFTFFYYSSNITLKSSYPNQDAEWESYKKPIEVEFNIPIDVYSLEPSITPDIVGKWEWEPFLGIQRISKKGKFISEETTIKTERITIFFVKLSKAFLLEKNEEVLNFKPVRAPIVREVFPKNGTKNIGVDANIEISLDKRNEKSFEWIIQAKPWIEFKEFIEQDRQIIFTPITEYLPNTEYSIVINRREVKFSYQEAGIVAYSEFSEPISFSFTTGPNLSNGAAPSQSNQPKFNLIVKTFVPLNNSVDVPVNIRPRIFFNSDMNRTDFESNFSISAEVEPKFNLNWISPHEVEIQFASELNFDTKYSVRFLNKFVYEFTTKANKYLIPNIPIIFQPFGSSSSALYSAKMALNWKGINASVNSLLSEIGYSDSKNVLGEFSGNPNKEFVGNAQGTSGYGVHWNAVQRVFTTRGLYTEIKSGWDIQNLIKKISDGYPVITWSYNGISQDYDKDWVATDGSYITAINGMHSQLIVGFEGTLEKPEKLITYDPLFGTKLYTLEEFDFMWSRLGRNGLVVY